MVVQQPTKNTPIESDRDRNNNVSHLTTTVSLQSVVWSNFYIMAASLPIIFFLYFAEPINITDIQYRRNYYSTEALFVVRREAGIGTQYHTMY